MLEKDHVVEVTIASLAHGGGGVGRHEDFVIFVPFTAPGDVIKVRITNSKKSYAEGEILELIKAGASRVEPPCPVFGICGGCQWQQVSYDEQLKQKQGIVEHALARIAKESGAEILPIIPSPQPFNYRNRAQFKTEGPKIGFYKRQSHELVEFEKCYIVDEKINKELSVIKEELKNAAPHATSKIEVILTSRGELVRSIDHTQGGELGFSQVNTLQNLNLRKYVQKIIGRPSQIAAEDTGSAGQILDLYCGQGNFSFPLNDNGWRVYGIDSNKEAIIAARKRKKDRTFFSANDCTSEVRKLSIEGRHFEYILIDPPRIGAEEELIKLLPSFNATKIVYISCNPATFARDFARLKDNSSYKLKSIQPFDMFPQTFHVELVAYFQK